jgi:hypothetical protein
MIFSADQRLANGAPMREVLHRSSDPAGGCLKPWYRFVIPSDARRLPTFN